MLGIGFGPALGFAFACWLSEEYERAVEEGEACEAVGLRAAEAAPAEAAPALAAPAAPDLAAPAAPALASGAA